MLRFDTAAIGQQLLYPDKTCTFEECVKLEIAQPLLVL